MAHRNHRDITLSELGAPREETPHPDTMPRLELWLDGRCYFVGEGRRRYRVYDIAYGPPECAPGTKRVVPHESPKAKYRWFTRADGEERSCQFERGDDRQLTPERVARQLANAGYPATQRFDPATRDPR